MIEQLIQQMSIVNVLLADASSYFAVYYLSYSPWHEPFPHEIYQFQGFYFLELDSIFPMHPIELQIAVEVYWQLGLADLIEDSLRGKTDSASWQHQRPKNSLFSTFRFCWMSDKQPVMSEEHHLTRLKWPRESVHPVIS